jgi:putative flippase GtrA
LAKYRKPNAHESISEKTELKFDHFWALGFLAGFVSNFLLHSRITFRAAYTHAQLLRFMMVVLLNFLLSMCIVFAFQEGLNAALLGKLLSLPLVAVNGFFLGKYWVFR